MSRSNNFGVELNLSNFFNDHRLRTRIFVGEKIQTVKDLQDKISGIFDIENFYLSAGNQFLPPSEDVRIINEHEILWAFRIKSDEYTLEQPESDIVIKPKKPKTKRKEEFKSDEQSSDELCIPKKRKKIGELDLINVTNKKKKHKGGEPCVSSEINVVVNEKLEKQLLKKSKKKKKHNKLEDIEMDEVEDINLQNISKKKTHSIDDKVIQNLSIDESFKKNKLLYTKNSPLPTTTGEYLKHKKVNIVKIDYVNGKSEITKDKGEVFLDTNEISLTASTIPNIGSSDDNKIENNGDECINKVSDGKDSISKIETAKEHLQPDEPYEFLQQDKDCPVKPTSKVAIPDVQATNLKFCNDPKGNDSNLKIQNENIAGKQKFFFLNSPRLNFGSRLEQLSKKTGPVIYDENGKLIPKLFKHPASYTETDPMSCIETKADQEAENRKTNNWKDGEFSKQITEIMHSTSIEPEKNVKESLNNKGRKISDNALDQITYIPTVLVHNESTNIISDKSFEYSGICLNETGELSRYEGDNQNSVGISGIQRISPGEPSKYQLSGIGPLLDDLRKASSSRASSLDSTVDSDCSEFVTRRRKRVRKRPRKSHESHGTAVHMPPPQPPPPPRPMNVQGAPSIHIKFDEEGREGGDGVGEVSRNEAVVEIVDSPCEEVRTSLEDIMRAPSMESMKPRVGDIIAFKILKIGPSYQPELSSHIVGKVKEYHIDEDQIVFEIIGGLNQCKEPEGKFSMKQDGDENCNFENRRRKYNWRDLIEPRLLYP